MNGFEFVRVINVKFDQEVHVLDLSDFFLTSPKTKSSGTTLLV